MESATSKLTPDVGAATPMPTSPVCSTVMFSSGPVVEIIAKRPPVSCDLRNQLLADSGGSKVMVASVPAYPGRTAKSGTFNASVAPIDTTPIVAEDPSKVKPLVAVKMLAADQ